MRILVSSDSQSMSGMYLHDHNQQALPLPVSGVPLPPKSRALWISIVGLMVFGF